MGFIGDAFNAVAGASDARAASPNAYEEFLPKTLRDAKDVYAEDVLRQRGLAEMLLAQAQGFGPNPAQNMLNQATSNNIQQAAALAASQRGINPAMAARVGAMNAAQANQQAAGQGAVMNAQQILGSRDALGNLYNTMAGQSLNNLGSVRNYIQGMNSLEGSTQQFNAQAEANAASKRGQLFQNALKAAGGMIGGSAGGAPSGMAAAGGGANVTGSGYWASNPYSMSHGGEVPGVALMEGDHPANDVVPAKLSPGEIVIPRSHAGSAEAAKSFIDELIKKRQKDSEPSGYAKVLQAQRALKEAMASFIEEA